MIKSIIFDCLDTIQGYKGAPKGASKRFYQEHIADVAGIQVEEFLRKTPVEDQLHLAYQELKKGSLEPVMLDGAGEVLSYVKEKRLTSIVVTADLPQVAVLAAKPFIAEKLICSDNVHGIFYDGSKKKAETWAKVKGLYFPESEINGIFEDTPANLDAAVEAYSTHGYQVNQTEEGLTRVSSYIIRGGLHSILQDLQKRFENE